MSKKPRGKVTNEEIIAALDRTFGLLTIAAAELNITYEALIKRIHSKQGTALRAKLHEMTEQVKDRLELTIFTKALIEKNLDATKFLLVNKARDRGYGQQEQLPDTKPGYTVEGGFDVVDDKDKDDKNNNVKIYIPTEYDEE